MRKPDGNAANASSTGASVFRFATILLSIFTACGGSGGGSETAEVTFNFSSPQECATCHPRQYKEWLGSMMSYATVSPVFNALEAVGNSLTDGELAADGSQELFCQKCHTPIGVQLGEFPPFDQTAGRPSRDFAGEIAQHGVSCDFCHRVAHADMKGSLLGDGIANVALIMTPSRIKYGPFEDPFPSPFHDIEPSSFIRSSEFCGGCHDVRLSGTDVVTKEPFLRLENLFTEWKNGPYATAQNPLGRVTTCQDCHMSAFPYAPPGTYFQDRATTYGDTPIRRAATHYFTGVDVALVDFPGQEPGGRDSHGLPVGQKARREDLIKAALALDVRLPSVAFAGATLPVIVNVTNVGAGHNVPAGFSQERQVWIELTVSDRDGIIYRTGYLTDKAHPETGEMEPDGSLDDEDLENLLVTTDPHSFESHVEPGPDVNQRPDVDLGLVNFGNEFKHVADDVAEEVFLPFFANHMDNGHSIPPLQTVQVSYAVPVPEEAQGPLRVSVRLRFRAFPPHFLRALAQARPDLVDEDLVDRNRVVEMAEMSQLMTLLDPR